MNAISVKKIIRGLALLGLVLGLSSQATAQTLVDGFVDELVLNGLNLPTNFATLPDGRMLITEKGGKVRVVKNGVLQATPFINLTPVVNDYLDRGLLAVAADANFTTNQFVYLFYVYENDAADYGGAKTSRLIRVTANGDVAVPGSEVTILGSLVGSSCNNFPVGADCIPADNPSHTVGTIKVALDGTLFVSMGDGASFDVVDDNALRAQSLDSLGGKILHITTTGAGDPVNPYWNGNANANRSKVWAYGFRNPFRIELHPLTGAPFVGDVGWTEWEEVNALKPASPGANFGWPCYEGLLHQSGYEGKPLCQALYAQGPQAVQMPEVAYYHSVSSSAVVGGAFYTGTAFPSRYYGAYFYADYAIGFIRYLQVNDAGVVTGPATGFATGRAGPVYFTTDGDNLLYLAILTGELRRIRATDSNPTFSYLTDLTWTSATNGRGPVQRDQSNGEADPQDGRVLTIGTQDYAKGLGTHAPSDVRYALNGSCSIFTATVGIDAEVNGAGSVNFQVWTDGVKKYDSGLMTGAMAAKNVSVNVSGATELQLVVTDGGDNIDSDHGDWASAKVTCTGDTTPPIVTSTNPAAGATGISGGANATATFSEAMDPASLTTTTFIVTPQGSSTPVAAVVSYDSTSKTVTLNPNGNLTANILYTATIKGGSAGAKDLAGNPLAADKVWTFKIDATAPTVVSVSPTDGFSGITYTVNATATFSEAMDPATLTTTTVTLIPQGSSTPVAAAVDYSPATTTVTLDPTASLAAGTVYTARIKGGSSGAKDQAGNALAADKVWTFTTAAAGTSAYLSDRTWTSMTNGYGPVERDKSNGGDQTGDGLTITLNGTSYAKGLGAHAPSDVRYPLNGTCSAFTAVVGVDDEVGPEGSVVFQVWSDGALLYDSGVMTGSTQSKNVFVNITGRTELALLINDAGDGVGFDHGDWADAQVSCSGDTTAPTVTTVTPASGATAIAIGTNVSAVFSEAMNGSTVTGTNVTLVPQGSSTPVAGALTYDSGTRTVTLDPTANLVPSTVYTATIKGGSGGVQDLAGNPMAADRVWTFTTTVSDIVPPTVASVSPPAGSVGVTVVVNAAAVFSEPMLASSLTAATVTLVPQGSGTPVTAAVTYDPATLTVTLDPAVSLTASTTYTATILSGVNGAKDTAGNPLAADRIWTFTTAIAGASAYVSDRTMTSMSNGWGPVERDRSNGDLGAADGLVLTLNGVTYAKGLGSHAPADIRYALNGTCSTFTAVVGIDDEVGALGSVGFQVWTDGVLRYDSGVMTGASASRNAFVNVASATELQLVVTNGGDDVNSDHADWADAQLACGGDTTPPTITATVPATAATGVVLSADVTATFSEAMNAATLTGSTVSLVRQSTGTPVSAAVSYNAGTRTVTLNPTSNLVAGAVYTATILGGASGAKDIAGNPLAANQVWSFTTNAPPTPVITLPLTTFKYKVGDVVTYAGSANDPEEGSLPGTSLHWDILLHHCPGDICHVHPFTGTDGATGSFTAPDHGDENYFELILSATDSAGQVGTVSVNVQPQTVQVTLDSTPVGLQVVYGGTGAAAPATYTTVVGSTHTIFTPSPQAGVAFTSWSDGNPQQHNVTVGAASVAYVATFGSADTTPPTISVVTPAQSATSVPVSTNVTATFSEAMDVTTLNGATVTLTPQGSGTPIAATITYDASSRTVTLDPTPALAPSTVHTAVVRSGASGAKDVAGNPLAVDRIWTFTTAAAPDTTPPTVSSVSPAQGATNVIVTSNLSAVFSEAVDVATVTSATVTLVPQGSSTPLAAAVVYDGATKSVTLNPTAALTPGTLYTGTVKGGSGGVKDLAGNALAADRVWTFTTAAADTTPPAVSAVDPADGAVAVVVTANVTAVFSEAMDPATLTTATVTLLAQGSSTPVAATVVYIPASTSVALDPSANLAQGTTYAATIKGGSGGAKDLAGNPLVSDKIWTFTTASPVDTTPPVVSTVSPSSGSTSVAANANITATFSEAVNASTVTTATVTLVPQGSATPVAAAVTYNASTFTVTLDPTADLAAGTLYTATVKGGASGVKDLAGNALAADRVWTFTTVGGGGGTSYLSDRTWTSMTNGWGQVERDQSNGENATGDGGPLTLNGVVYPKGLGTHAPSDVRFALGGVCNTFTAVVGIDDEITINGTVVFQVWADGTMRFDSGVMTPTTANKAVSVSIAGASELQLVVTDGGDGQDWDHGDWADAKVSCGSDTTPPTVTLMSPASGATAVAVTANTTATFSEAMNATTLTTSTVTLLAQGNATPVAAAVTYNAAALTVTLHPTASLAAGTVYTATVKGGGSGVKDAAGNALAADRVWTFTTASAVDTTPPTVTTVTPAAGATGVVVSANSTATFSEAMNASTLTTTTVTLLAQGNATPVAATVTYSAVTLAVTLDPTADLAPGTLYTATVKGGSSGAKDVAGNALAADRVWTFTTAGGGGGGTSFLSDRTFTSSTNGWGPVERDKSNGDIAAGDGLPITLNGIVYAKGLGTNAPSDIRFALGGACSTFTAVVGVDDEITFSGSIVFQVWTDGTQIYDSGLMTPTTANKAVSLNIAGASQLQLVVTDGGNGQGWDHGDWADAQVTCGSDTTPPMVTTVSPASGATAVPLNANTTAVFSEAMTASSLTTATVTLLAQGNATPVPAAVTYNAATFTVTLDPTANLAAATVYTATIKSGSSGAKDSAGNALAVDRVWTFTTASGGATASFLSDRAFTLSTNGWGPVERDKSNNEAAAGDGGPLTLNGVVYAKGLGTHAISDVRFALGGTCSVFTAVVGVDDEVGANGSVVFQVRTDGTLRYDSGLMTGVTASKNVSVDLTGVSELALAVTNGGDDQSYDHADWANAQVVCN